MPTTVLLPVLIQCCQCSPSWPRAGLAVRSATAEAFFKAITPAHRAPSVGLGLMHARKQEMDPEDDAASLDNDRPLKDTGKVCHNLSCPWLY